MAQLMGWVWGCRKNELSSQSFVSPERHRADEGWESTGQTKDCEVFTDAHFEFVAHHPALQPPCRCPEYILGLGTRNEGPG